MLKCIDPMTPPSHEVSKLYRDHHKLREQQKYDVVETDSENSSLGDPSSIDEDVVDPEVDEVRAIAKALQ
jgi:hypothetical protein